MCGRVREPGIAASGDVLLRPAQGDSLNLRGAYPEVMGGFAGSVAVIVAAAVIALTAWTTADAVASVAIGLLIPPRTWDLPAPLVCVAG